MNEVVYLEPDEEITSVIDKLKALSADQKTVSLVIPKGSAILQSVVNLKLLKKESEVLEKDLSVVTQDRIGRNLASQAGFSVFDSISSTKPIVEPIRTQPKTEEVIELDLTEKKEPEDVPSGVAVHRYDNSYLGENKPAPINETASVSKEPEKIMSNNPVEHYQPKPESFTKPLNNKFSESKPPKEHTPMSKKKKIILGIIGGLLVAGGVLFYLYYPKANVNLTVKAEPLESSVEITADTKLNAPNVEKLAIKGELIETEQQGGKKFSATGKKDVGEKARGTVTISNDSSDAQKVNAGNDLKSDSGLAFKTSADVTIPGATATLVNNIPVKVLGKADVAVEASEAGDKYNVGPTSFSISGKSLLSGKSSNPMSGGLSKEVTVISQNDLNNAKSELTKDISNTNHEELKKKAGTNKIYDSSFKDEVTSEETDKKAGDEAGDFEMKIKVKSSAIDFNEKDYREMVVKALEKNVPADKTLSLSANDEISITGSEMDSVKGILKLKGDVKTKIIPKINESDVKNNLKGKNKSDAENYLKSIPGVITTDVQFKPSWLIKKIPGKVNNINIILKYQ